MSDQETAKPNLRALYERYGHSIYKRCLYLLKDPDDAQDAMHDVFIKVIHNYGDFREESSPLTWMTRIATNYCLNVIRSNKAGWKKRYEQTVQVDLAQRPNHEFSKLERDQLISQILDSIKPDLQEVAIYYFVDGMTQQDAATAAQCSVPTLRKRLRQFIDAARKKLKQIDADAVFGDVPI